MLPCFHVFDLDYSAILHILCRCFLVLPVLRVPILPSQCVTLFVDQSVLFSLAGQLNVRESEL